MSILDLYSLCRICMNDSGSYSNMFEERLMDESLLMEVVNDTCQLDIFYRDGLPHFLCCKCYTKITEFELFRRQAHEVNAVLLGLKDDTENDGIFSILPEEEEFIEEYSHEKPFLMEEEKRTYEECSKEGKEDDSLQNRSENVFVPVQTEIFLSDTEIDDDVEEVTPAEVDPLEDNDPAEGDLKMEKAGHLDLPVTEVPKDSEVVEDPPMNIKIVKIEHLATKEPEFQRIPVLLPRVNAQADSVIRLVKLNFVRNVPMAGSSTNEESKSRPLVLSANPGYELVKYGMDDDNLISQNTQRTLFRCKRCRSLFPKLIQVQRHMCVQRQVDSNCLNKVESSKTLTLDNHKRLFTVERTIKKPSLVKLNFVRNVPMAGSSTNEESKSRPLVLSANPGYELVKYGMDDDDLMSQNTQRTLFRCKRCRSLFPKLIQVQRHMCVQ